jgi:chromosome segregation ATPase
VSAELVQAVPGWERVQEALGEICACHADLNGFINGVTTEFDQWGETFAQRQRQLQQQTTCQRETQASALHAEEERFSAWQKEVERQCGEIRQGHTTMEEQIQRLSNLAAEVATGQKELLSHRQEWTEQCETLANLPHALAATERPAPEADPSFQELRQQYSELQQERILLESELENVRSRAAELTELLSEQKRSAMERQAHWDEELRCMRLLLESMAGRQAEVERQIVQRLGTAPNPPPAADPVLGSVLAQFELIQQDCARRRQN